MKIAINTRFLLKNKLEGIGWFTYEVCKRLVERFPEHQFYFLFDRPFDKSFVFGPNVQPIVVNPPARRPPLWYWWFELSLPRVLRRLKPDVFFSPDGYASLRSKIPTVMVTHDLAFEHFPDHVPGMVGRYYRYFTPRFHQRAERIIAVSRFTKSDIEQRYGLAGEKVAVACNGVRRHFQALSEVQKKAVREKYTGGKPYFFYLGSIHPRKNVALLISAFDLFKQGCKTEAQLLIGGRMAWQTKAIKTAYKQAQFQKDVVFMGFVPDEELPQILGAAIALTYISLFEGFGVPLLEAMHCETPIITSKTTALGEIAGKAGRLVDPTAADQVATAMQDLYTDETKRKVLIDQGKIQRKKYSWEKATKVVWENILNVYNESRRC